MSRLVEAVAPTRLGVGFRWLLGSSWTSNLGDGIAISGRPAARGLTDQVTRSWWRSPRCCSGCHRWCSACTPEPWRTGWTGG
ncbi:MAG: hypothetical protein WKF47_12645 [Geodermatophilaceae bacterium]